MDSKTLDKPGSHKPWKPVPWTEEQVGALKALERGEAMPHQQVMALKFIINVIADVHGMHFYPDQRDTDFALGKAFVGQQIGKLCNLDPAVYRTGGRGEQG